jgi:hypothetical protein
MAWIFALFWNAIAWPVTVIALRQELPKGNYGVLFVLLFPLVGLGLLSWAIVELGRWRKFGETILELATTPAAIGGQLAGTLRLRQPVLNREGFRLKLSCIHRTVTGSGKNRSTHESIRWQEDQLVHKDFDLPVFFRIPADAEPTDLANPHNCTLWRLDVSAAVEGVDFQASYDVPVFRTATEPAVLADTAAKFREPAPAAERPRDSKIQYDRYAPGGPQLYYPPARHVGVASGLTVFLLIWGGAVWFMITKHAPVMFPVIFGAVGLGILYGVLHLWFGSTRVVVDQQGVRVTSGLPGLQRTRTITRAELQEIKLEIGMQSGNTPYYDIVLRLTNGRRTKAGTMLKSKAEAQWIVDEMCDRLSGR